MVQLFAHRRWASGQKIKQRRRLQQQAQRAGVGGIKVSCAGRLGGADMSRTEWFREGRVPLHTLRAHVDYGVAEALTTYGITGVKVWIYHGDVD